MQRSTEERENINGQKSINVQEKAALWRGKSGFAVRHAPAASGWLKQGICILLAGLIAVSQPVSVTATSTSQMEKEKRDAQKKLDEANQKAKDAEAQRNAAQAQVSSLNDELTEILSEIALLEADIADKELQIQQAQKDYDEAKATEEKQYEAMKKRIKYMYEKGDTEYLEILLKVKSMSDLLNKSEYITEIYNYDRRMLKEYQETKLQVQAYQEELENDKADMEVMELEYKGQQSNLEETIAKKRREVANFDEQYAKAKQDAANYASTIAQKNEQIRKAQEEARKRAQEEARRQEAARQQQATIGRSASAASQPAAGPSTSGKSSAPTKSSGGTAAGRAVADYGLQFVGNPYVYGGTSLTNGADCSGFVQSVYKNFGISLPRTSTEQRSAGVGVEYADAQPGDIICYAGHVGIYIGNGQIVHASSPSTGIKVGNAAYRTILAVRRIIQ